MDELGRKMEIHGFIRVPFCSDDMDGKECADIIKDRYHANIRGSLYGSDAKPKKKKCIACGKEATIYLYASKQY